MLKHSSNLMKRFVVLFSSCGLLTTIFSYVANQIALLAQSLHNSHMKRTFLESFAKDPAQFIQTWLESQSRDLESILGNGPMEGLTLRQEELRRSEFFQLPWVEEVRYTTLYMLFRTLTTKPFFLFIRPWPFRKASDWRQKQ